MDRDGVKMSGISFLLWLCVAMLFDIGSFLPLVGWVFSPLFIALARLSFWIIGYRGISIEGMLVTMVIEATPGVSLLPASMGFVIWSFVRNRAATPHKRKHPREAGAQTQTQKN